MVKITTQTFLGDAQIHHPEFRATNDIDLYLSDTLYINETLSNTFTKKPHTLFQTLAQLTEVEAYSPRIFSGAMLSSSDNVTSGVIYGVNAEQEAKISKVKQAITTGHYLTGAQGEIIIGEALADLLAITLGDRLVVTVSQAHGGELSQALFRVSGLFKFNDRNMDNHLAFINLTQGQTLLNIQGVHEIALRLTPSALNNPQANLWKILNNDQLETLSWQALVPQLNSMLEMTNYSTLIVAIIMYMLVALGLVNTMFMSIYERHNEFGILLAIGTRPHYLFWQIMTEGLLIGFFSALFGLFIGLLLSIWGAISGVTYMSANNNGGSGIEFSGITLNEPIYLIIEPLAFAQLSLSIIAITLLTCIYPALHAAHLQPSLAMRKAL